MLDLDWWENSLEQEIATDPSILAGINPWIEEPGRLQSVGSQKSWRQLSNSTITISGKLVSKYVNFELCKTFRYVSLVYEMCPLCPHGLARQAPLSMGFSRQEYWSALPFLLIFLEKIASPRDLPNPGIKLVSYSSALVGRFFTTEPAGKPKDCIVHIVFLGWKLLILCLWRRDCPPRAQGDGWWPGDLNSDLCQFSSYDLCQYLTYSNSTEHMNRFRLWSSYIPCFSFRKYL